MADRIAPLNQSREMVRADFTPSDQFMFWANKLTNQALIVGTGSPEGVVEANQTTVYMDDAGITGSIVYIKRDPDDGLGDVTKGWVLI